jgi:hypothetical protein
LAQEGVGEFVAAEWLNKVLLAGKREK